VKKKLTGKLDITRPMGSGENIISMRLHDDATGLIVWELDISAEDFAMGITGLSSRPVTFALFAAEFAGGRREHKEEIVPRVDGEFPGATYLERKKAEADAALKPFEVDGWRGARGDYGNGHRSDGQGNYRVSFNRYFKPGEDIAS